MVNLSSPVVPEDVVLSTNIQKKYNSVGRQWNTYWRTFWEVMYQALSLLFKILTLGQGA